MKGKKSFLIISAIIIVLIGGLAIYSYTNILKQPSSKATYNFITANFNTTITNQSVKAYSIPSTLNATNETITFPQGNYIFFVGGEFCPYCASESYVMSYLFTNKIPAYNNSFYIAEYNIPAVPTTYITKQANNKGSKLSQRNFTFVPIENPLTAIQLTSEPKQMVKTQIDTWINSLSPLHKYFVEANETIPRIYVTSTVGNTTKLCEAYAGVKLVRFNSNTTKHFTQFNMVGLPYKSIVPYPPTLNENLNILNSCMNAVVNK